MNADILFGIGRNIYAITTMIETSSKMPMVTGTQTFVVVGSIQMANARA
jgi:hypothetical protein